MPESCIQIGKTMSDSPRDRLRPMSVEEIETLREDIKEVRDEVREDLAMDFGGEPEDYRF